jgi:peroxiredoxin
LSKKKISKNKHKKISAAPKKFWQRTPTRIFILALLAVVVVAVAFFLLRSFIEENLANPGNEFSISNISITKVTETSITATWTTNRPAAGELHATMLESGTTLSSWQDKTLVRKHEATVLALQPSKVYKLKVVSTDAADKKLEVEIEQLYTTLTMRTIGIFVGDRSPDFSLPSTTGKNVSSADYAGKRTLIIFWKLSCNACKAELPYINDFYKNLAGKGIEVLTINPLEKAELIKTYLDSQKFTFPVLLDADGKVAEIFTVATYPSSFLIDSSGNIAKIKEVAFNNVAEISEFVK